MKRLLLLAVILLAGCDSRDIIDTAVHDLGYVRHIKLCDNSINKTCNVVLTTVTIDNLQVTKFPSGDIKYNDHLFFRYVQYSHKINIQYCNNNSCKPYASCYTFMKCYTAYYNKMELLNKKYK